MKRNSVRVSWHRLIFSLRLHWRISRSIMKSAQRITSDVWCYNVIGADIDAFSPIQLQMSPGASIFMRHAEWKRQNGEPKTAVTDFFGGSSLDIEIFSFPCAVAIVLWRKMMLYHGRRFDDIIRCQRSAKKVVSGHSTSVSLPRHFNDRQSTANGYYRISTGDENNDAPLYLIGSSRNISGRLH